MKKIGSVLYNKLALQAEEASHQNKNKLANHITEAIGSVYDDRAPEYDRTEMENDIHQGLWKLATCVLRYYNSTSVDAEKLDAILESLASEFVEGVEVVLDTELSNTNEPKLPGEIK